MRNSTIISFIIIIFLAAASLFIVLPLDHPAWLEGALSQNDAPRDLEEFKLGLDLRGGTQVLLEADVLEGQPVDSDSMDTAKTIIDLRVNGLGVTESNVQRQGDDRIIVELPGVDNPDQAVDTLRSTGQLEFVDAAGQFLTQGMIINTSNRPDAATNALALLY